MKEVKEGTKDMSGGSKCLEQLTHTTGAPHQLSKSQILLDIHMLCPILTKTSQGKYYSFVFSW